MITVVGGIKGGGGKTTLATNLVVMRSEHRQKVLLVDADEQRSAADWAAQRDALGMETKWTTIQLTGKNIHSDLKKLSNNYDDVIVDVGGRDNTSQRSALAIAHVCLIPFKPKSFDMWTLGQVKTMVMQAKAVNPGIKVYAVVNQADSRGPDNEEAMEMIRELEDFVCLDISIGNRKTFANAAAEGLGVTELKKADPKAIEEMRSLYFQIYGANI